MARRGPVTHSPLRRWLAGVGVVLLAVVVVALSAVALSHTRAEEPTGTTQPVPTFTTMSTATATPTPTTTAVAAPGAEERFLAAGSGVLWRATAGVCGGTAPTLERSDDDGATWTDVTPTYLGVAQILSLDTFSTGQAEIVALVGSSCETQALRTFTAWEFWASYPEVLAASTYLSPTDPTSVVTPDGTVAAPCAQPWGVRSESGTTGLICDGAAYQLTSGAWSEVSADAAAIAVASGTFVAVSASQVEAPAAIALDGNNVLAWSGSGIVTVR